MLFTDKVQVLVIDCFCEFIRHIVFFFTFLCLGQNTFRLSVAPFDSNHVWDVSTVCTHALLQHEE